MSPAEPSRLLNSSLEELGCFWKNTDGRISPAESGCLLSTSSGGIRLENPNKKRWTKTRFASLLESSKRRPTTLILSNIDYPQKSALLETQNAVWFSQYLLDLLFTHAAGTYEIRENFDLARPADRPAKGQTPNIIIDFVTGRFVFNFTP